MSWSAGRVGNERTAGRPHDLWFLSAGTVVTPAALQIGRVLCGPRPEKIFRASVAADANRLATTFLDPRDGRRRAGCGIVLEHGAGVAADRVGGGAVVIGANVHVCDDGGHDDNRAVSAADLFAIAVRGVIRAPDQPSPVHCPR